jgi:pimeloyl-ACP methyl ester carboxylesterase
MHFSRSAYCTAGFLLVAAGAQPAPEPAAGRASFIVFVKGVQIGREDVDLSRGPGGWTISASGRLAPPIDLTTKRFEVRYGTDWQPIELKLDASFRGQTIGLNSSFGVTTAINEITQQDKTTSKTDQISARTIVMPNNHFAAYEALAVRLAGASTGDELRAYIAPQAEIPIRVGEIAAETIRTPERALPVRRIRLTFQNPGGGLDADLWVDDKRRLARLEIPSVSLQVVRDELATVSARRETASHPGDEPVNIPAAGFTLAATVTQPPAPAAAERMKQPVIVLLGGAGGTDRDETISGVPVLAGLAGSLADAGFVVARYDKRGVGQSGGRLESATLADFAEDARAVIKYLGKRKDVDPRRIAVAGYGEGGSVALIAASREKSITAVVLIAAVGTTGAELILEQQRHVLERSNAPEAEKQQKIELQKTIQQAVITGTGWDAVAPELRKQADTTLFKSLLQFDPASIVPRVRQPILIVQGALDTHVPPHHATRLGELANARKKAPKTEVLVVDGVNHLLIPAKTGEADEYDQLTDKKVSPKVVDPIVEWLKGR